MFDNVSDPVKFVGYVSGDDKLPAALIELRGVLDEVLSELAGEAGGKFAYEVVDPEAGDGALAQEVLERFGFQPMALSLFDDAGFYFYLTLQGGETVVQLPIPDAVSQEALRKSVEEGLKRFATGILKNVVLAAPQAPPPYMRQQGMPPGNQFTQLESFLTGDFNVTRDDLSSGQVPANAEMLIVVDPSGYDDKQVFAVDQFLMRGGTVVISSAPFAAQISQGGLQASPRDSGLAEWLQHMGASVEESLVLDPQNSAFPIPITRQVGGFSFQDLAMLDYPYFPDIRADGINADVPATVGINQLTVSWASPLKLEPKAEVSAFELLHTSAGSWLSDSLDVSPQFDETGLSTFAPQGEQARRLVAGGLQGRFESYFADQASPLLESPDTSTDAPDGDADGSGEEDVAADAEAETQVGTVASVIRRAPESARLMVIASNDFLADQTLQMVGSADGTMYTNPLQLMVNVVDWALEDQNLIGIRARGHFNRTLPPMAESEQAWLEYLNYGLALLGIVLVYLVFRQRQRARTALQATWFSAEEGARV